MTIFIIFGVGVIVSLMTLGGVVLTVMEIRAMGRNPENYNPNPDRSFFRISSPKKDSE